jgi:5-methylcytosine-specific restriction protein A
MPTYLFSWNPLSAFTWPNNSANSAATRRGEIVRLRWSTGGTTSIVAGDRIFLGKLGQDPIGVIASGVAASDCFEDNHWEGDSRRTTYNMVDFDTILGPENVLPRSRLREGSLGDVHWDTEYGGVTIGEEAAEALEAKWRDWTGFAGFPRIEPQLEQSAFRHFGYTGWIKLRLHFLLERESKMVQAKRNEALIRRGRLECEVCGFVFANAYGGHGAGFIECHDRRAFSTLDPTGDLDVSVEDLAVVCANCHRMLHWKDFPSVEELRLRLVTPGATSQA